MAVGFSGRRKMPAAHFFSNHTPADVQSNLVLDCIQRLYDISSACTAYISLHLSLLIVFRVFIMLLCSDIYR